MSKPTPKQKLIEAVNEMKRIAAQNESFGQFLFIKDVAKGEYRACGKFLQLIEEILP